MQDFAALASTRLHLSSGIGIRVRRRGIASGFHASCVAVTVAVSQRIRVLR